MFKLVNFANNARNGKLIKRQCTLSTVKENVSERVWRHDTQYNVPELNDTLHNCENLKCLAKCHSLTNFTIIILSAIMMIVVMLKVVGVILNIFMYASVYLPTFSLCLSLSLSVCPTVFSLSLYIYYVCVCVCTYIRDIRGRDTYSTYIIELVLFTMKDYCDIH